MPAHSMIIVKLKNAMHNLMKSLLEALTEPEDYIVWAEEVEQNSEDEQISLKVKSLSDHDMDIEMTALALETRGETSAISDIGKSKGYAEKQKTVIKIELTKKKASSLSAPHLKSTA
ncbi:hypothetical protein EW146_g5954 [Bondarzewia mesenterica]|uniref:Uncharacterized protein n=1 Tax=Bondarzewia mesenterica TaxID=1095465 RepID=A0A4S4LPW9_9AGAM|nr:hypothetical protein EW146_g5954 [Bondarzewia mesenterica]